jgi:hypothetical protein
VAKTDYEQVQELMVRYGRAIDTRDLLALRRCFTADMVARYASFAKELHGHGELEAYIHSAVTRLDATHHMFMNFIVDLEGDAGRFSCSVQAQHVLANAPGGGLYTVGGDYLNDVVRTPEGWKMTRLDFRPLWTSGNPDLVAHEPSTA